MRKALILVGLILIVLVGVIGVRTATFSSRQLAVTPIERLPVQEETAAARLAGALRFRTVSVARGESPAAAEFLALHQYLEGAFPFTHTLLERELVNDYSLLYTWPGTNQALPPLVLTAHLDVVPVDPATESQWTHPPFEGAIEEGAVWGRGAIDDKASVIGILEAVERLIADGFQPRRTLILAFGHDEEIGGGDGAGAIAQLLQSRGVQPLMVVDEGGIISMDGMPGLTRPAALVAVAEKGYVTLDLTVTAVGGHSSAPPAQTAVGVLSAAITRLEQRQFPSRLDGVPRLMMEYVGPEMPMSSRIALANLWLFRPMVERRLASDPTSAAALRTTTAPTIFSAGLKDNVLPQRASAAVNFRIKTGESVASVVDRVKQVVDDERVQVTLRDGFASEPSPVSPTDTEAFTLLKRTTREVFPDVVATPFLSPGATDARYYTALTPNVYRFLPVRMRRGDLAGIHGVNERIRVSDFADAIRFYHRLIVNVDAS